MGRFSKWFKGVQDPPPQAGPSVHQVQQRPVSTLQQTQQVQQVQQPRLNELETQTWYSNTPLPPYELHASATNQQTNINGASQNNANNFPARGGAAPAQANGAGPLQSPQASAGDILKEAATFILQLEQRLRGSVLISITTLPSKHEALKISHVGILASQLTMQERGEPIWSHPVMQDRSVAPNLIPGSQLLDGDPEILPSYYSNSKPGTMTLHGYSQEYTYAQRASKITVDVMLTDGNKDKLPSVPVATLVARYALIRSKFARDMSNASLATIMGMTATLRTATSRPGQITAICYFLNAADSTSLAKLSRADESIMTHIFRATTADIGSQHFLHLIVLGAELLCRLLLEPATKDYFGFISMGTSRLLHITDHFLKNITITGDPTNSNRYLLGTNPSRQLEGLNHLAKAMQWPHRDALQVYTQDVYQRHQKGATLPAHTIDWIYGVGYPGSLFSSRIFACLASAAGIPTTVIGINTGLVIGNVSYWRSGSVLGRVLGALRTTGSEAGWVGPCPKPDGAPEGWKHISATPVNFPAPVNSAVTKSWLQPGENAVDYARHHNNVANWQSWSPTKFSRPAHGAVKLQRLSLSQMAENTWRARLTFDVGVQCMDMHLFSNPNIIEATPCFGQHPLYVRQLEALLQNTYHASALQNVHPRTVGDMCIIDTSGGGDEQVLARAWCAEHGLNAIVWDPRESCIGCCAKSASARDGIGCKVIIKV